MPAATAISISRVPRQHRAYSDEEKRPAALRPARAMCSRWQPYVIGSAMRRQRAKRPARTEGGI